MMSPDEAIEVLKSLQYWLYLCGGTNTQREALDIAIACLEEKCHE